VSRPNVDPFSLAAPAPPAGTKAVIASGAGRYADPWHPYAETSARLADLLGANGFAVEIDEDLDAAMGRLDDVTLLVVNAGDPWRNAERAALPAESREGFRTALERGIGVLAMHTAPATMRDYPEWAPAVGAVWLPGISMHPPADVAEIEVVDSRFSADAAFEVFDERYCELQEIGRSAVVARHAAEGKHYPTAWVREVGRSRVAVDVLGHDGRSYDSHAHRALIAGLARWASVTSR
jgi:type 1 glutamine amidotransferase